MARNVVIHTELHSLAEEKDSIAFIADIDGVEIHCYITSEALRKYFSSSTSNIRDCFLEHQDEIASVAESLLNERYVDGMTEFMIREEEFSKLP